MTHDHRCPDSLVVRARYGSLSFVEQARCDAHVAHCEDCQVALAVGRDFDRATAARRGDDALIARVAEQALIAAPAPAPGRTTTRYRVALLVAAAMTVTAGAAAAATSAFMRPEAPAPAGASGAAPPTSSVAPPSRIAPAAEPVVSPPTTPETAPETTTVASPPTHVERPAPAPDAPTLFARANAHRRAGEVRAAIEDYRTLQRTYARSTEALVSHVVLGTLLLDSARDEAGALRQFDRYLAQDAHRDLTEEALDGRGRALQRLGRSDDERATWQRLLDDFPASAYAPRARERLAALE